MSNYIHKLPLPIEEYYATKYMTGEEQDASPRFTAARPTGSIVKRVYTPLQSSFCSQNPRPRPRPRPPLGRPRSVPLPRPRPLASSFFLFLGFGASSTRRVSRGNASGRTKYRILFPRMDRLSSDVGSRLRAVILTVLRCVFICMSTPRITALSLENDRYVESARKTYL